MKAVDLKQKNHQNIMYLKHHEIQTDAGRVDVPLLHFSLFDDLNMVKHCFTTREGGCSTGIYKSMNLSYTRGDDSQCVDENYRRIAKTFGMETTDFICTDQTHTTNVMRVGRELAGCGVTRPKRYADIDGFITNETGIILATFYADCVPLYFVDPVHRAIGLSHSGWRGTVSRMGEKTVRSMEEAFGTKPQDVYAAIGPSICQDCYEVDTEVAEQFLKEFPEHREEILLENGDGKYQLDLWKANEIVLLDAGILKEHMAVSNICTCCNREYLFSHRGSGGKRGNLGAFLSLQS